MQVRISVLGKMALSYLLGLGLQTLIMFYLAVLHIKLTALNVTIAVLIPTLLIILLNVLFKKKFLSNVNLNFKKLNFVEKLMIVIFFGLAAYVLAAGIYWPVVGWDSIALYDFRAKVFSITGYMDDAIRRGYFFGYPLMTSMAHTWIYILGGHYPKFLYSLMYISFGLLFYEFSQKWANRTIAMVFTIISMTAYPIFAQAAYDYTNVPYTIYFFISSAALFYWTTTNEKKWLIVSALMMGIATWIRSTDPFWIVNIIVIVWWSIKNKSISPILIYILFFLPIQQSWNLFITKMSPSVSSQSLLAGGFSVLVSKLDLNRLAQTSSFVIQVLFSMLIPYSILLLISLTMAKKKILDTFYFLLILFGNISLLFVGAYIFSYIWEGWGLIGESLGRMGSVFIPLFTFAAAINLNEKVIYKK